jgi:aspartyl-tRNA(Asn)/glutamyl-tRNA(Gln) amidotransferase subunit A
VSDLAYLPATEALARFGTRELSPVELVTAVVERAERVEPPIGAFCDTRYEHALEAARAAEARYAGRGEAPRPLEGLPVALKEEQALAGEPLRLGSLLTGDAREPAAHPVIERVLAAGAIAHARSTTPEFSCAGFTHSRLWGPTRNPWHLDRSPGGSSGGSAAALAAGSATLATGSDIAGSIRIPASMCGVVGFKPPHGRVPDLAPYTLDPYCANGPLARTVADCALLEDVMAGPHPFDPASQRPRHRLPDELGAVAGLRIALCAVPGDYAVEPEVAANARTAAAALVDAGAQVEEVDLGWSRGDVVRAAMVHYGTLWTPYLAGLLGSGDDDPDERAMPYTLDLLARCAAAVRETGVYGGVLLEARVLEALSRVHERFDALLCPTLGLPALDAGEDYVGGGPTVDGQRLAHYFEMLLTIPFNVAGRCPVLAVPSGWAADGVPTGVQLVGRTYDDDTVFHAGAALERAGFGFGGDARRRPSLDEPSATGGEGP